MKIYIAGKISGLTKEQYSKNFNEVENLLEALGLVPVSPLSNGLPEDVPWHEHMLADIALLFECEGIYLQKNWTQSKGARIEYQIAKETGKTILHEEDEAIEAIKYVENAVYEATGLLLPSYRERKRSLALYYARMLFANIAIRWINLNDIAKLLNRSNQTIERYFDEYPKEFSHNKNFQKIAKKAFSKIQKS